MPKQPASKNDVPAKDTVVPDAAGEKPAKATGAPKQPETVTVPVGKDPATTPKPKASGPKNDTVKKGAVGERGTKPGSQAGSKDSQAHPAKAQATEARANPTPGDSAHKSAAKTSLAPSPGKQPAFTAKETATKWPQASSKNAGNAMSADLPAKNAVDAKTPTKNSAVPGNESAVPKSVASAPNPKSAGAPNPVATSDTKPVQAEAAKAQSMAAKPDAASISKPGKLAAKAPATSTEPNKQSTAKSEPNPGKDSAGTKTVSATPTPKNGADPKPAPKPTSKAVLAVDPNQAQAEAGEPVAAAPATSSKPGTKEPAPANFAEKRDPFTATKPEAGLAAEATPVPAAGTESATPSTGDKSAVPVDRSVEAAPMAQSTPGKPTGKPSKGASRGLMMALMIVSFILEVALLGAVAIWGMAELPFSPAVAVIITVVPLVILWAVFMSPKASLRLPQPFHAVTAHVLFAVGAGLLALSGQPVLAICMGVLIAISLALTVAVRGQNVAGRPPKGTGRRAAR